MALDWRYMTLNQALTHAITPLDGLAVRAIKDEDGKQLDLVLFPTKYIQRSPMLVHMLNKVRLSQVSQKGTKVSITFDTSSPTKYASKELGNEQVIKPPFVTIVFANQETVDFSFSSEANPNIDTSGERLNQEEIEEALQCSQEMIEALASLDASRN